MNPLTSRLRDLLLCVLFLVAVGACSKAEPPERSPASAAEAQESPQQARAPAADKAQQKRVVAREIEVTMRAKSPGSVAAQLTRLAEAQGGYVVSSNVQSAAPGSIGAELSLRVAAAQIEPILAQLRTMGEVRSEVRKGDDVTSEVVDTEARLTARRTFERRLLELLSGARSVDDMLKVEAELSRVRTEIEQLVGQARTLAQRTEFALLHVTIESPEALRAAAESFGARLKNAVRSAVSTSETVILGFIEFVGGVLPLGVIFALIWLPIRALRRRAVLRRARLAANAMEAVDEPKSSES